MEGGVSEDELPSEIPETPPRSAQEPFGRVQGHGDGEKDQGGDDGHGGNSHNDGGESNHAGTDSDPDLPSITKCCCMPIPLMITAQLSGPGLGAAHTIINATRYTHVAKLGREVIAGLRNLDDPNLDPNGHPRVAADAKIETMTVVWGGPRFSGVRSTIICEENLDAVLLLLDKRSGGDEINIELAPRWQETDEAL